MGEPGTTTVIMEESKDIATKQYGPVLPPNNSAAGNPVVPPVVTMEERKFVDADQESSTV